MRKKIVLVLGLMALIALLAGCSGMNQPIDEHTTGFWSHYFVYPLSWFIITIADLFNGSFGVSIIITTLIVRLVLMPLMFKQVKSSKAMQDIQPEIKKLREKYSSKDQKTQRKLQEETMKLFSANKINPLAGCLPLIVQMPVLLAFYHAISRTEAIKHQSFLWFNLGMPDHFYILPIVTGITTFIQQKLMLGKTGNANPQMAMMVYIFPIFIAGMAFAFPAALALYWVVGNIFMIFQTYIIYAEKKGSKESLSGGTKK
ncbi:YidC family membrane integrase SpoIIIJ [Terrilactibacillus sp. BCM23-1]|uniref:Membrane protein insertase YidC n=1 Tax=Terrilactibacillus tamarindi TaxID=2599694 RepID=A0A6N8CST1_9BACI|nr:YidC family membrane integrase SpoIIIJ [Terrilactibacillus tamarindi]MTT31056.1 YidC family membrane integrase SpoIIIJ [Terrilactibacillus tamarindi]